MNSKRQFFSIFFSLHLLPFIYKKWSFCFSFRRNQMCTNNILVDYFVVSKPCAGLWAYENLWQLYSFISHLLRQWNDEKSQKKKERITRKQRTKTKHMDKYKCKRCCHKIIRLPVSDVDDKTKKWLPMRTSRTSLKDRQQGRSLKRRCFHSVHETSTSGTVPIAIAPTIATTKVHRTNFCTFLYT